MTTPTPAPAPQPAPAGDFPGKTLGIVGLVLAILVPLVGLIISVVANNQSKAAGYPNQLAKIGIIVGAILTALWLIGVIISIVASAALISSVPTY
jgi:cytochrome b561